MKSYLGVSMGTPGTALAVPGGSKRKFRILSALCALVLAGSGPAFGALVNFERITTNAPGDATSQLTLEITAQGSQPLFVFSNDGAGIDAVITQVWIEDTLGVLTGYSFSPGNSSAAVSFLGGATPSLPPGLAAFTADFSQGAASPEFDNGIGTGSSGGFLGDLSFSFPLLEAALENGQFRVAINVQQVVSSGGDDDDDGGDGGGDDGGDGGDDDDDGGTLTIFNDTYLSLEPDDPIIPEPGAGMLAALALLPLIRRRR